ncbi:SDR family oxidoreductase [Ancylobacter oerskovii]|uniref:SDR family oxidoreductase n=1 Tax=Ancylobacter oerskovii TaxID=459519 RepID=A0ABW4YYL5_9HYPH|nr:SDR family oxidoreductase [Ancylobacter oerskovii]MBS7541754.1 SDR family oxidoreductase [Ancylobacter oerskovii]
MDISGNSILITGGNSGIGRALAEALQAQGNEIIITGRREEALKETAAANPGMHWRVLDVADAAAVATFADQIVRDFPALNVVVNNAGIMLPEQLNAEPVDLSASEAIITTNLLGPIRLSTALLPHFKRRPAATVVTVSSGLAFVPLVVTPTYNATKAAIHSWSQSLRAQLADTSVGVIEIVPPLVATELMPGQSQNPNALPLDAFIAEVVELLKANPRGPEICVERVGFLRGAEARGDYAKVFAILNDGTH